MYNRRAQLVKEASQIPVGGSEDEAKERVKRLFKPRQTLDQVFTAEEIEQLEHEYWLDWILTNNELYKGKN